MAYVTVAFEFPGSFSSLPVEELDRINQELAAARDDIRKYQTRLNAARDRVIEREKAIKAIQKLPEETRSAVAQVISAEGFEVFTKFGELGNG